jgi:amiloride-sensitive sodium channel
MKITRDYKLVYDFEYYNPIRVFRVFWSLCCIMSWLGSVWLMMKSWESYRTNAISFVVETTSLEFQTTFPGVSVCETDNAANVQKLSTK